MNANELLWCELEGDPGCTYGSCERNFRFASPSFVTTRYITDRIGWICAIAHELIAAENHCVTIDIHYET